MDRRILTLLGLLLATAPAVAGLHYSGEQFAELPAQWRGYLLDQRALRMVAGKLASPLQESYRRECDRLAKLPAPTADETADLGALYVRLGEPDKAVAVLRDGLRRNPEHFRTAANLGAANQSAGDLAQAETALEIAVRLAPPRWKSAEALHLKLVRLRRTEAKGAGGLDALFAEPPSDAVSLVQTLGLWLPADGRVLWQLGELAHLSGDDGTAAAILDGCVTEFGLDDRSVRANRQTYRKSAEGAPLTKADAQGVHDAHRGPGTIRFQSARPLVRKPDLLRFPPVLETGLNNLQWPLLAETTLEKPFRPTYAEHLRKLDGKRVVLNGFLQPTGDGLEQSTVFLMEYPVGCWFCEVPEPTGLLVVEPPGGKSFTMTRELVRVEGRLKLNSNDPEDFLYSIKEAKVGPLE